MSNKKVLVVSNMYPSKSFPSYGVFVKNFCAQLSDVGIITRLSVLTKTENKVLKVMRYIVFYLFTFFKCLIENPDLVYIHYPSFSAKPVLIARRIRKFDIISNVHGTDVIPLKPEHQKMLINTEKAIRVSKTVVVPSEYFKNLVVEKYGINASKVFVYPSAGVDENVFFEYSEQQKDALRKKYGIQAEAFVIGFVSRMSKAKGWDVFIDAVEELIEKNNTAIKAIMVGSGEDDDELSRRISASPQLLQESIIRYPLLDQKELAEIFNLFDVFVFPTVSASESLGLVAVEAMSCGCPVIASNYAAPKYYVFDDVNGYKFEKGNANDLAAKLEHFIELSDSDKKSLKEGAISTSKRFARHNIIIDLKKIFEE